MNDCKHDDVTKWKPFFVLLAFCAGNSPVAGEFPSHFDDSLMWVRMSWYTDSRMTGDFRLRDTYVTSS